MIKKDIEYIFKKIFFSESYLLKRRLKRAINKNYEKELKIIERYTDKTKDALDVGVYRGVYSLKLSENFKTVHSFEPNPLLFKYLEKNLKKIIKNLTLYNIALSDNNGDTELKLPLRKKSFFSGNIEELYQLGAATIHQDNKIKSYKTITIKTKKLDDIEITNDIGFIKIDVEGHEKNVLKGGEKIIKKNKPPLLVEIEKRHSGKDVIETIEFINSYGYNAYYLKNNDLQEISKLGNFEEENNYFFLSE